MRLNPRWLGLAATTLLAVSGFLAGKPYHHDAAWVSGVCVWFVALLALGYAWWGLRGVTRPRELLVTAAIWSLPLLVAPPMGALDVYAYACQGQLFDAGINLYEHGPSALPCTWLSEVPPLWRDTPTPYGPLWFAISGGVSWLAHGHLAVAVGLFRLVAVLGLILCVAAAHRLTGSNAVLAASPLVLVHVVSGVHNDILLAAFVLAGFALAARARPALSGLAFGLAAAIKVTALVAAPFAVLLLLSRRRRDPVTFTATAIAVYAALAAVTGHGLGFLRALGATAGLVQWLSIPSGVGMAIGYVLRWSGQPGAFGTAVAVARAVGFVTLAALLLWLWLRTLRTVRHADPNAAPAVDPVLTAAGLALLAMAVLGPVFYAWYALAGITVLAGTRLTGRLRTGVHVAVVALPFLTLPDSLGLATKTKVPGAFLDLALVVALIVRLARTRRRPVALPGLHGRATARSGDGADA
ncbi:polyprenol phosphomannose-dependent alpha 1,6 mannosyltransferase MptB [Dactylosporangium sp. CA-233914]|uniref:polyprenol phosphomannose-dependent alpha 1,6 mannosyltransferase MptB n=1 Tax=Dactylosporangium sp. CA-233914 TaxID=3239934 RepID=UPI003D94C408